MDTPHVTLEQWRARREEERKRARETPVALTQEEAMGDFYFETRNYELAAEQYTSAMKKLPEARHLRKKLLYTQYNIGVQCIKRRDYAQALSIMEQVLKLDPGNSHAQKKVLQLRKIIGRSNQPQTEGDRVGERP